MADTLAVEDRQAIKDIIHRYFWLVDHGRATEIPRLFTESGTLEFAEGAPSPGVLLRPEIERTMKAHQMQSIWTRHVVSNVVLEPRGAGLVAASSLLTLYRSDQKLGDAVSVLVGDVEDTFELDEGGWRIRTRLISPIIAVAR